MISDPWTKSSLKPDTLDVTSIEPSLPRAVPPSFVPDSTKRVSLRTCDVYLLGTAFAPQSGNQRLHPKTTYYSLIFSAKSLSLTHQGIYLLYTLSPYHLSPSITARPPNTKAAAHMKAMQDRTAQEIRSHLGLPPNQDEKGYLSQTFRDTATGRTRGASTAAYYLLEGSAGPSVWHCVDAAEVWHYYTGAPLTLSIWTEEHGMRYEELGPDIFGGQRPQIVVRAGEWQSARCEGKWTLVGTTGKNTPLHSRVRGLKLTVCSLVAPGFVDSSIEFASPGWEPPGR